MRSFVRSPVRLLGSALFLAALVATPGCFPQPSTTRDRVPANLEALHGNIEECRRDFESAIELLVDGDRVLGENLLTASSERMRVLAETCAQTQGCDMELFTNALGRVYRQRSAALRTPERRRRQAEAERSEEASAQMVDAMPQIRRAVNLLKGTDLRELIEPNGPVKAAMYDWLTWDRPGLMDAYENYQFLRRRIAPIYEEANLPEALLFAVMATETGAKVHAYSRAGAAGPMQFMRQTGHRYGLHYVDGFDMRYDPEAATRASVAYLNDQFELLNDDLEKVLAAYNAGETRVRRLDRKLKGVEFWDPAMYGALPKETRDYVPKVLAAAWLFLHEQEYGLDFPSFENGATTIELVDEMALGELTICLGHSGYRNGWYRTLRNLNPRRSGIKRVDAGEELEIPAHLVSRYVSHCVDDAEPLLLARSLHDANFPQ